VISSLRFSSTRTRISSTRARASFRVVGPHSVIVAFGEHRQELFDEERIPLGHVADPDAGGYRERRAVNELLDQLFRLGIGKRLEGDCLSAPTGAHFEELLPGKTEKQKRSVQMSSGAPSDSAAASSSSACASRKISTSGQ
jgi:hypothetical protein